MLPECLKREKDSRDGQPNVSREGQPNVSRDGRPNVSRVGRRILVGMDGRPSLLNKIRHHFGFSSALILSLNCLQLLNFSALLLCEC
jgi:hypothetical protein